MLLSNAAVYTERAQDSGLKMGYANLPSSKILERFKSFNELKKTFPSTTLNYALRPIVKAAKRETYFW